MLSHQKRRVIFDAPPPFVGLTSAMHVSRRAGVRIVHQVRAFQSRRSVHAEQRDVDWEQQQQAAPHAWYVPDQALSPPPPPARVRASTIESMLRDWERKHVENERVPELDTSWLRVTPKDEALAAHVMQHGRVEWAPDAGWDEDDAMALHVTPLMPKRAHHASFPVRRIRDLFDWRTTAVSQQGRSLPGHVYTHLIGEAWDATSWVWTRRKPSHTLLLRTAHQVARAASRKHTHYPGYDTSAGRALTLASRRYQQHWRHVLSLERAHHELELQEQREQPIHELEARGLAIDRLMAFWQTERHFGRRVGVFKWPGSRRLPPHKFQPGSVVDVAPRGSQDWIQTEVLDVSPTRIRVRFSESHENLDLAAHEQWRMDRGERNVVVEREDAALDALLYAPNDVVRAMTPEKRYALAGTELRDILTGQASSMGGLFVNDMRIRSWYERYARADPIVLDGDPDLGLNASQLRAVAMMLRERVSLVQGPPGTGKTRTLVQTVSLLKQHFQVPHPILLAAHTNVAVDNLAEGCVRAGLRVVRAGSSTAARDSIIPHTYEAQCQRHACYASLQEAEKALRDVQAKRDAVSISLDTSDAVRQQWQRLKRRVTQLTAKCHVLRRRIQADVLHHADVVCTTAIAAGSNQLSAIDFPIVFLDESSMATEPIALIPLMKGCAQLALVGDHKQLPPVLHSTDARTAGLSTSLFERLLRGKTVHGTDAAPVPSTMLDVQFRMHPALASFPNQEFYGGALYDAPSTHTLRPYETIFGARDAQDHPLPVTLVTHTSVAPQSDAGVSPYNQPQADLVLEVACDLLERNPTLCGADIGIVTPYEAQVRLLQKMLAAGAPLAAGTEPAAWTLPLLSEDAVDTLARMDVHRARQLAAIEVHTVDGFEGREKPVMIFSTVKASGGSLEGSAALLHACRRPSQDAVARLEHVRDTRGGYVGFLADARRMNVALTRAQRQLLIVGNLETLLCARLGEGGAENVECHDVHVIRRYARWLLAQGYVVDVDDVRDRQLLEQAI